MKVVELRPLWSLLQEDPNCLEGKIMGIRTPQGLKFVYVEHSFHFDGFVYINGALRLDDTTEVIVR